MNMNTGTQKTVLSIAIVIVFAGAFYYYVHKNMSVTQPVEGRPTGTTQAPPQTTYSSTSPATGGKKVPFSQLAQEEGTYKCSVTQIADNAKGTIYMDSGLVKGEFNTAYNGTPVTAFFLMRDGYIYTWNSLTPGTGMKMKSTIKPGDSATATPSYLNSFGDYDCEEWSADASVFVAPKNTTFTDIK
jgi:hypothetical protein